MIGKGILYIDGGHSSYCPIEKKYLTDGKRYEHIGLKLHDNGWFYEGVSNRAAVYYLAFTAIKYGITPIVISDDIQDDSKDALLSNKGERLGQRLRNRANFANKHYNSIKDPNTQKRCAFISLHADAADDPNVRGSKLLPLLGNSRSLFLAQCLNEKLISLPNYRHKGVFPNSDFAILKTPKMATVLFERGFFTNREDAQLLDTNAYLEAQMNAISLGLLKFFENDTNPL